VEKLRFDQLSAEFLSNCEHIQSCFRNLPRKTNLNANTMRLFYFLILCLFVLNTFGQTDKQLLERELFNLPNVSFTDVSKPGDSFLTYDLMVKQPLDH